MDFFVVDSLESFIVIFDNSSPKGFSGQKMKKSTKALLSADFLFLQLQSATLNTQVLLRMGRVSDCHMHISRV